MSMIWLLAFVVGGVFGLSKVRVWGLLLIGFVFAPAVFAVGFVMHFTLGWIALGFFVSLILLQAAYLSAIAVSEIMLREKQVPLSPVQWAIADELRDYFLPPNDLPKQLRDKLSVLQSR
jgi:hypothetical protein